MATEHEAIAGSDSFETRPALAVMINAESPSKKSTASYGCPGNTASIRAARQGNVSRCGGRHLV